MLFTSLLLTAGQATAIAVSSSPPAWLSYISVIALFFSIYIFFSNRKKESEDKTKETIKKLETSIAHHEIVHTQHQNMIEKFADGFTERIRHAEERVSKIDEISYRFQALENKIGTIETKLESYNNNIKEMKESIKENQKELLELIKKGK